MEKWQKDLISMIEAVADEVEQFFLGINDMVDAFFEITEEVTEEVQSTLALILMLSLPCTNNFYKT